MKAIDVLVLGGGPAGSTIALTLARAGRAVTLVERSRYEQPRVGETLAPSARLSLASLGLWERFERQGHAPSYAIRSAWGEPQLYEQDFTFHPYGTGWHLDRQLFDGMIADAAEEAGATVYRGGRLEGSLQEECGGWRVSLRHEGAVHRVQASFVVDTTGRVASFARRRGAVRKAHDALVGVLGFLSPVSPQINPDFYTLVEAKECGWWYSALLPDLRMVAIYLTDADLLPRGRQSLLAFWQARLKQTDYTRARLGSFNVESGPRVVAANSSTLDRLYGSGWLAAGSRGGRGGASSICRPNGIRFSGGTHNSMRVTMVMPQWHLTRFHLRALPQALESGALAGQALERQAASNAGRSPPSGNAGAVPKRMGGDRTPATVIEQALSKGEVNYEQD